MFAGVADTHAALWFLFGDPRLSTTAKRFFETAARERRKIVLASISLAEVVYLVEKNRLPATAFEDLTTAIRNPNHVLEEAALTSGVAAAMRLVPRDAVPDMPDRIVAATAVYLGVPVISRDGRIRASSVQTIW
jgi:PIN domain nuclease of toxin-antitoxin system